MKKILKRLNFGNNTLEMTPNSAEFYLKNIKDDPNINKLTFTENGSVYEFDIKAFKELETIGVSRYVVKKYLHSITKQEVAIKFINLPHNRNSADEESVKKLKYLLREIQHFRELRNSPNILQFYGYTLYEGQILLCMELMDMSLSELCKQIHENNLSFPENILGCIAASVLDALIACKSNELIHRDIKPANILVSKSGRVKVGDFGETRILHDSMASSLAGTFCYWPPEHFKQSDEKKKCDVRADIWSLGIVLVELVLGTVPYKDSKGNIPNNIILLQNQIINLKAEELVESTFLIPTYSEEVREFVRLCLQDIEIRPKYDELQATAFYQRYGLMVNEERSQIISTWLNC